MPITITLPDPHQLVGLGLGIQLKSDFIGPLGANATWHLQINAEPPAEAEFWSQFFPAKSTELQTLVGTDRTTTLPLLTAPKDADPVVVTSALFDTTGAQVDSGTAPATWSSTAGLGNQALALTTTTVDNGFTTSDRESLAQIQGWVVLDRFITQMSLESLGVSPPGGQIGSELPTAVYGVLVRFTQLDPTLVPATPDDDYFVKTLGVVRVFKGSDIVVRVPLHRSSQIIPFFGNGLSLQVASLWFSEWAAGLTLEVDLLAGCAAEVFLMHSP